MNKKLQWHQAFYAGIQIEFENEKHKLVFENEHHIGTQPKRIDVLIIKKEDDSIIEKNIGKIFRKHNIIEYKSPSDYISINDFYLVYGYACLYKSDESPDAKISIDDITISFVCHRYPRNLIEHLKSIHKYNIRFIEKGIYYIEGNVFPIQLLVTKDLSDKQNLWLHNLSNDIQDPTVIDNLISEYEKHPENNHYKSVMDIIVHANKDAFKEVTVVCKALEDLYWEVHGERILREQKEALDKAVSEAVSAAVSAAVAEKDAYIQELEAQLKIQTA